MINYLCVDKLEDLKEYTSMDELAQFLHASLIPFEDPVEIIRKGLNYAFSNKDGEGGFVLLAREADSTVGALVMLDTGMSGYVPPNLLLYIAVKPDMRGKGIGGNLIRAAFERADGDVKLHVEHENPARRLYERMGFESKYAEMRYSG
jgi:[ribosomal protein S18]-alanine N-acetyltransferase